jgi:type IV pilus assembly protein PilV
MESKFRQQGGFTLIEGLVATAILGVGLLGLAGMQGISLNRNVDSNEIGRVTNIAADMMERIKFNRRNALSYHGIDTIAGCAAVPVAQLMARGDCTQWKTLVDNSGLANADGIVAVTRLDPDPAVNPVTLNQFSVTVRINWTGSMKGETSAPRAKTVIFSSVLAPE